MQSYHNDPAVKEKYVQRFAAHRAADDVVQGMGYENGRGCFVGCTLNDYDHSRFPIELGWPEWLARLADSIFEGLPKKKAPQFGTDLLTAVPIGADLQKVQAPFLISIHLRNLARLSGNTDPYAEQCRSAIQGVIQYLQTEFDNDSAAWSVGAAALAAESAASAASAGAAAWAAESKLQAESLLSIIRKLKA